MFPNFPVVRTPARGEVMVRVYATAPYARMIVIPTGYETIRLPGIVADPLQPAVDGTAAVWGDTEQQAESVFGKIRAVLAEIGAGEGDVVAMTVYLVAPPHLRGRAAGFLSIFIGSSVIGFYNAGALFEMYPSATAMSLMAAEGLVPLLILGIFWWRSPMQPRHSPA